MRPRRRSGWTRVWLGAFAAFGTVVAHVLAYSLMAPDPHVRTELLRATGHHHWDVFGALAIGAAVAGVGGVMLNQLTSRQSEPSKPVYRYAASRLVIFQCLLFVALEGVERLVFAGDVHGGEVRILVVGLAVQVVVALLIAAIVVILTQTIEFFSHGAVVTSPDAAAHLGFVCVEGPRPRWRLARGSRTLRGPPVYVFET